MRFAVFLAQISIKCKLVYGCSSNSAADYKVNADSLTPCSVLTPILSISEILLLKTIPLTSFILDK